MTGPCVSGISPLSPLPSLLTVNEVPPAPCVEPTPAAPTGADRFVGTFPESGCDPMQRGAGGAADFAACGPAATPANRGEAESAQLYLDTGTGFATLDPLLFGLEACTAPLPEEPFCLPGPPVNYEFGLRAEAAGDFSAAIGYFDRAIEGAPDEARYYFERSYCQARLGDLNAALEDARAARRLDPENEQYAIHQGIVEYVHGDYEASAESLSLLGQLPFCFETDPRVYLMWAAVRLMKRDFIGAEAALGEALSQNPNLEMAYLMRGIALVQQEEFEAALPDLNRGLAALPNDAQGLVFRGIAEMNLQMFSRAAGDFRLANQLKPEDPQILEFLQQVQEYLPRNQVDFE